MKELVARNWGLIFSETQEKIGRARLLLVGCGLGSQIGVLAARTGFANFELWDGDKVEEHNLNRQAFVQSDIGLNKAEATAKLLKAVNLKVIVEARPTFLLDREEIVAAVKKADFVVNMADPDKAMWTISEITRAEAKVELHPLNMGWMGYCLVLTPTTPSLEEIVGGKICGLGFYSHLVEVTLGNIPESFLRLLKEHGEEILSGKVPFPQLGITTNLTSALVVEALVRWLAGDDTLPVAPRPLRK